MEMKTRINLIVTSLVIMSVVLVACGGNNGVLSPAEKTVTISIAYGSEKQAWIEPLIQKYNDAQHKTSGGSTIIVTATAMGSIESVNAIIGQRMQPTVWSPASSIYIPVANA